MKERRLYRWFSICSAHGLIPQDDCAACNVGHWEFMPFHYVSRFVYWVSPWLWRKWANRGNSKKRFKNMFTDKKGNKVDAFPNL